MPYMMKCPSCGLSLRLSASFLAIENCPRCLARRGRAVRMSTSGVGIRMSAAGDASVAPVGRVDSPRRNRLAAAFVEFEIVSQRTGSSHRIAPRGELDVATSRTLDREIVRVEQSDVSRIELDLRGVTFIDSAGVHVLVGAHHRARLAGRRLQLTRGPRVVQRILALVELDELLLFAPSLDLSSRIPESEARFVAEWSR
jgi:anti-anti-sigma factor